MLEKQNRRRFLQTSVAAGTLLTLAGGSVPRVAGWPATEANPPARPGRVRWHADFAAACTAARGSGKPAFLFHMLGRLDQKFC